MVVEVVVCTKPGGKEALVQGKYTQAGNKAVMVEGKYTQLENKAAMVEGKYTQAGNRTGMGAETIIEKAINTHTHPQPQNTPTQPWPS